MTQIKEVSKEEISARFEELFKELTSDVKKQVKDGDVVFRNGLAQGSFDSVDFMMATDRNGTSYLYSVQPNGNSLYSVVSGINKRSFVA